MLRTFSASRPILRQCPTQLNRVTGSRLANRARILTWPQPSLSARCLSGTRKLCEDLSTKTMTDLTEKAEAVREVEDSATRHEHRSIENTQEALRSSVTELEVEKAVRSVQKLQEAKTVTANEYMELFSKMSATRLNLNTYMEVVHWFNRRQPAVPRDILRNLEVWKGVLKIGFNLSAEKSRELSYLARAFERHIDLDALKDQTAWELLIRAHGLSHNPSRVTECLSYISGNPQLAEAIDFCSLRGSAVLAYATNGDDEKVQSLLRTISEDGKSLDQDFYTRLIRIYAFNGDVAQTQFYSKQYTQLYPDAATDTLNLLAHKKALNQEYLNIVKIYGETGVPLEKSSSVRLNALHDSWKQLTDNIDMLDQEKCVLMIEYLSKANTIDPKRFPMKKAQEILDNVMPSHGIAPCAAAYTALLQGYASTRQYSRHSTSNARLDMAMETFLSMRQDGFSINDTEIFRSLYRACIPSLPNHYPFDYFRLRSSLTRKARRQGAIRNLDSRFYEIEKLMLEAKVPYDRLSMRLVLTCLGGSGNYSGMWSRLRLMSRAGIDCGLNIYRLVFALASFDKDASIHALTMVRPEMLRNMKTPILTWDAHVAMLDCAVAAETPLLAKEIMERMREECKSVQQGREESSELKHWPYLDSPQFYFPLVYACFNIKGLEVQGRMLLDEMNSKAIPYHNPLWDCIMTHLATTGAGHAKIQEQFSAYTMSRFERTGKIPIPVRESPAVPLPSGPYTGFDAQMINMYLAALVDSQDVSLVFDAMKTFADQGAKLSIYPNVVDGIIRLAEKEKCVEELKWLQEDILPRLRDSKRHRQKIE